MLSALRVDALSLPHGVQSTWPPARLLCVFRLKMMYAPPADGLCGPQRWCCGDDADVAAVRQWISSKVAVFASKPHVHMKCALLSLSSSDVSSAGLVVWSSCVSSFVCILHGVLPSSVKQLHNTSLLPALPLSLDQANAMMYAGWTIVGVRPARM